MFRTWFKKLCKILSSAEFAISVYPSGGLASLNAWMAHHFNHIPLYGLVLIFLITAASTVALIKWITELYRQKSLKYKLVISGLDLIKHLLFDEAQERLVGFGVALLNNSDIPVFYKLELINYHLANQTVPNLSECVDKEDHFISPRCYSKMLFPATKIPFINTNRTGEIVFNIHYGKKHDSLNYKLNIRIDIAFIILLDGSFDFSHNIKKFEYI